MKSKVQSPKSKVAAAIFVLSLSTVYRLPSTCEAQEFAGSPDAWRPSTRISAPPAETVAYGWPYCQPRQPISNGIRAVPSTPRQPSTYADPASQQPQLSQVQVNAPDLSKYALKSDLQSYVTRDEATAALKQLQSQAGTLGNDAKSLKERLEELVSKTNSNFSTVQDDLKNFNAAAADKVAALDTKVSNLAATPAGKAVVAAGGNVLDKSVGFGLTAVVAKVFTFAGLPGLGLLAGGLLARKFLAPKLPADLASKLGALEGYVKSRLGEGGGGGAASDPFRGSRDSADGPGKRAAIASDAEN